MTNASSRVNSFDLFLKYGAAFFATAYGLGVIYQHAVWFSMGAPNATFPLADSGYFVQGVTVEVVCMIFALLSIIQGGFKNLVDLLFFEHPLPQFIAGIVEFVEGSRLQLAVLQFLVPFTFFVWWFYTKADFTIGTTLILAASSALVNVIVSLTLLNPDVFLSATLRQQLGILTFVGLGLLAFAAGWGVAEGRRFLREPDLNARLLIAPDAVEGLKELGLVFPDASKGTTFAQPTATVSVLYEGETLYVVRTANGKVLQIKGDKVWSSAPAP